MRTTIDLPDALLRQLKAQAATEGITLKQLVLTLVEKGLLSNKGQASRPGKRSPLPVLNLKRPLSIGSFSNASLFELLDD